MHYSDVIGRLIAKIGRPDFDAAFFELARRMLDISSCSAFAFAEEKQPYPVLLEGLGSEQRSRTKLLGTAYVRDGFRSDPQLQQLFNVADIQVQLVDPSQIGDTAFRGHYYEEPRITSEIAVLAKYNRKRYNIGFYRCSGKAPFDRSILEKAHELALIAVPALHRHVELVMVDPEVGDVDTSDWSTTPSEQMLEHLAAVLLAEGHGLSPREAQVCAAIILGYRTLAISLNLGISENTICTHRKRAYAKLGISSQNELFQRYFRTVTRLASDTRGAPANPVGVHEAAIHYS